MPSAPIHLLQLLDLAAAGDHSAFADVYDHTSSEVWRLVTLLAGDEKAAGDATVDVYEQVWRLSALAKEQTISPLAWILGIAMRRSQESAA